MKKAGVLLTILAALLISGGCTRIDPGHVGIVVDMAGSQRGVQDYTTTTGWVFYNPAGTSVVEYPTFVQTAVWTKDPGEGHPANEEITFTTKDAMVVAVDVNLSYSLDAQKIPHFYVKFRSDDLDAFTHGFLHNMARDCFNETAGKYDVTQIMGDNAPFLSDARACLQSRVADIGVEVTQFGIIGAPRPPESVIQAINMKVQAQQIALQKQNEVMQATADAQKRVAQATGEAEANRKLAESLSPTLLEWRKLAITEEAVQKWNGQRPTVEGSGGGLLLNIPVNQQH